MQYFYWFSLINYYSLLSIGICIQVVSARNRVKYIERHQDMNIKNGKLELIDLTSRVVDLHLHFNNYFSWVLIFSPSFACRTTLCLVYFISSFLGLIRRHLLRIGQTYRQPRENVIVVGPVVEKIHDIGARVGDKWYYDRIILMCRYIAKTCKSVLILPQWIQIKLFGRLIEQHLPYYVHGYIGRTCLLIVPSCSLSQQSQKPCHITINHSIQ